ncbi:multidrug transporter [Paenibacillus selenitireducens]|uniref:Multidrug transporter n=1 Tax=Paenibacillus selenitireducens TaxID=1324314 RepID=A0A1T2XAK9_9BACL|nr:Flp1 family type IVb pilin [Paenibacillus selenitireducens]OPA76931.1 multidrug transporter [Paenibacillus selenitireducens]
MLNLGKLLNDVWKDEDGLGTVEIIFIIAVLVVIVLLFKDKIMEFIERLMGKATSESDKLFEG